VARAGASSKKLTASDADAGDSFGSSVSISGDTAVVGAYKYNGSSTDSGAVYVFVRSGTSWSEQQKLIPDDGFAGDQFGFSVSISNDTAVIGAPGAGSGSAYVFMRSGSLWSEQQKLDPYGTSSGDLFGWSVAISGDTAVSSSNGGGGPGSTYLFGRSGTTWSEPQKLTANAGTADDGFGNSVSIAGDTLVVGAPLIAASEGAVFAFVLKDTTPVCLGDGSEISCPCGNQSAPGEGCFHSGHVGMTISAEGTVSISVDELTISALQCPPINSGLFVSGSILATPGVPIFDGLFCVSGNTRRYRGLPQNDGVVNDTGFVAQAGPGYFIPGGTFFFQYWSRDVFQPSPCGAGANFSPALAVTMSP